MYSKDDIKPIDFKKHLYKNETKYFGSRGANPHSIASHIAEGALILGATNACIDQLDEWWFISSATDWLNTPNSIDTNEVNVFESLRGFPEGGQNNYRGEIMAMHFSSALVVSTKSGSKLIKGLESDLSTYSHLIETLQNHRRVLGFKFKPLL